jgi:hypothetical protein
MTSSSLLQNYPGVLHCKATAGSAPQPSDAPSALCKSEVIK